MPFGQLLRFETTTLQRSTAVVVDYDVGTRQQCGTSLLADGTVEVDIGASRTDVGLGVDELVLVVVGSGGAQHVRSVFGEGPTDGRPCDSVGK